MEDIEERLEKIESKVKKLDKENKELKRQNENFRDIFQNQKSASAGKISRRGFLKKLGAGVLGIGALSFNPVASNIKITKNGIDGGLGVDSLSVGGQPSGQHYELLAEYQDMGTEITVDTTDYNGIKIVYHADTQNSGNMQALLQINGHTNSDYKYNTVTTDGTISSTQTDSSFQLANHGAYDSQSAIFYIFPQWENHSNRTHGVGSVPTGPGEFIHRGWINGENTGHDINSIRIVMDGAIYSDIKVYGVPIEVSQ